jgi:RNA polymerase sigma factor (sigma-70 family)
MTKVMKQVEPVPEHELIVALKLGDEKILKLVYRQHYQMVVNLVVTNGGTLQESKDVFQETMIIFIEKIKEDGFELNCRIKTFLYSVSRRLWLEQLRHKNKYTGKVSETEEYLEVDLDHAFEKEAQFKAMHDALEALGEPCRSIMKDFYLNNQSMESITEKFGYTNSDNAKNQKYKCLKRLKRLFFENYNKLEGGQNYEEHIGE